MAIIAIAPGGALPAPSLDRPLPESSLPLLVRQVEPKAARVIVGTAQEPWSAGLQKRTQHCPVVVMPVPVGHPRVHEDVASENVVGGTRERQLAMRRRQCSLQPTIRAY